MFRKSIIIILGICALWLYSGCSTMQGRKKTNWNLNLSKEAKDPYGLYLTYKSLPHLFPGTPTEPLRSTYRLTNLGYKMRKDNQTSLLVMIGSNLSFNEGEIDSVLALVAEGHQVLLAADDFDEHLLNRLQLKQSYVHTDGSDTLGKVTLKDHKEQQRTYYSRIKKYAIESCFMDAGDTHEPLYYSIGFVKEHKPNFVVYAIGKGKLFLHTEPLLFTNYFLLQNQNRDYLNTTFSYITGPVAHIYWSDFNTRSTDKSDWSVIWKNPATRYALLIALFAILIYIIFEMKRRQRIIPLIAPVDNSSVAFVETIGRLYYNKKNHTNLAEKMVQHFLDFVRSNYYMNTNIMDEEFVRHLAAKSGKDIAQVDSLVHTVKEVQQGVKADEQFLYSLYTQIQSFYNG